MASTKYQVYGPAPVYYDDSGEPAYNLKSGGLLATIGADVVEVTPHGVLRFDSEDGESGALVNKGEWGYVEYAPTEEESD